MADEVADETEHESLRTVEDHVTKVSDLPTLEAELQTSANLEAIRRAAHHNACVLADDIHHSKLAFQVLLSVNSSMPVLTEYLEDRTLNAPKARNLQKLLGWTDLQKRSHDELEMLGLWLEKQVAYGYFSESEIREALLGIQRQHQSREALFSSRMFSWRICKRLWAGIQASSVNDAGNLQAETIKDFLEAASLAPLLHEGRAMGKRILLTTDPFKSKHLRHSIVNLVDRLSRVTVASSELAYEDRTNLRSFEWFSPVLENLSESDSAKIATTITLALTKHICNERAGSRTHLEAWFNMLPKHLFQLARNHVECEKNWLFIERNLVSLEPETLASYLRLFEDRKVYEFILNHWVPLRLQCTTATLHPGSLYRSWREASLRVDHEAHYPGADHQTTAFLGIVKELQEAYPLMLRSLIPELLNLLRCLERSKAILHIVQYLAKCPGGIDPVVVANEVTEHLALSLRTSVALFKADSRLRVEDCPGLVERMISEPVSGSPDVFLFLQRDRGLLGSVGSTVHSDRPLHVNSKRVALLHSMALAYAETRHLNPRQAYRKVRRCLDFFRDRQDLLGPDMSQALAKAGILRYLEAGMWVSTVRHNYILGYVKHLEGEQVANELDRVAWDWRGRNTHLALGTDTSNRDGDSTHS